MRSVFRCATAMASGNRFARLVVAETEQEAAKLAADNENLSWQVADVTNPTMTFDSSEPFQVLSVERMSDAEVAELRRTWRKETWRDVFLDHVERENGPEFFFAELDEATDQNPSEEIEHCYLIGENGTDEKKPLENDEQWYLVEVVETIQRSFLCRVQASSLEDAKAAAIASEGTEWEEDGIFILDDDSDFPVKYECLSAIIDSDQSPPMER